jgi:hypothetical protein
VRSPLFTRLLFVAYFVEVGLLLVFVPWSAFWEHNYFAGAVPAIGAIMRNAFVRGAVSGLGLVNLVAGLVELVSLLPKRRH